ncbi:MAG: type III-A CRISPR-associated RAMP protein Csm4 [Chitinophagales bacterium]|nr:MAG: type III-A CRISPR-associated RAMP protein Csm4 [Chitinophagales bacterium]
MTLTAIKLRFTAPLHIGGGIDLDKTEIIYRSDALKAALYAVGLPWFDAWKDASYFFSSFCISSCFPYAGNEYFFPRPYLNTRLKFNQTPEQEAGKKAKKITFLSQRVFEQFVAGNDQIIADEQCITPDGHFLCAAPNTAAGNFFLTAVQQRVTVPREGENEETRPFYADRLYFHNNCGLYFLAQFNDQQIQQQVYQALSLLGQLGIGSDRTVGNGFFSFDPQLDEAPFTFSITPTGQNKVINLGLYLPTYEELQHIDLNQSYWQLIKRGGYIAASAESRFSHLRKKSIYFFAEGSVLHASQQLKGKLENLRPDWNDSALHPVWRDGQCLFISL